MAGKKKYTQQQVIDALLATNGLVYLAAEKLGCTSNTIVNYQNRFPKIKATVQERRGRRIDIAEGKLDQAVLAGEPWAIRMMLLTQAKHRGYVERQEVTGGDNGPIEV